MVIEHQLGRGIACVLFAGLVLMATTVVSQGWWKIGELA
jgi:hypothetical protein